MHRADHSSRGVLPTMVCPMGVNDLHHGRYLGTMGGGGSNQEEKYLQITRFVIWRARHFRKENICRKTSCLSRAPIWPVSIITNSCTHSSIFIKNTLKIHVKFTPTCFGSQMEPSSGGQQLILAKVYKWFNGASPYSQYYGGIRKPICVYS